MSSDPPAKRIKILDEASLHCRGNEAVPLSTDPRGTPMGQQEHISKTERMREKRQTKSETRLETLNKYRVYAANLLAKWIHECDDDHSHDCQPRPMDEREPHEIPDWVVDTLDGCIVPGRSVDRYAALSYCWPRQFTYPQDVLVAFNGVLNRLRLTLSSSFVHGVPTAYINDVLAWQPHSRAVRRLCRLEDGIAPSRYLPSWSWCGWSRAVDPYSLSAGLDDSIGDAQKVSWTRFRTTVKSRWSLLSEDRMQEQSLVSAGPGGKCPMEANHQTRPTTQARQDVELDRITQYQSSVSNVISEAAGLRSEHWPFITCMTPRAHFRIRAILHYGIPMARLRRRRGRTSLLPPPLLPKTSVFNMTHISTSPRPKQACSVMTLEDDHGHWAGVLRVMDDIRKPPDDEIELKAISLGEVGHSDLASTVFEENVDHEERFKFPGAKEPLRYQRRLRKEGYINRDPYFKVSQSDLMDLADDDEAKRFAAGRRINEFIQRENEAMDPLNEVRPDDLVQLFRDKANGVDLSEKTGTYEFYNVLWIEREGDIAYRRAAGRIKKEVWEQHCSEPVKVILGYNMSCLVTYHWKIDLFTSAVPAFILYRTVKAGFPMFATFEAT